MSAMARFLVAALFAFCASSAFAAVDVNRATQAELEAVRGVGPALAEQILAQRRKAVFRDWKDFIDRIHGVGAGSAARLSAAGLTIEGVGYGPAGKAATASAVRP